MTKNDSPQRPRPADSRSARTPGASSEPEAAHGSPLVRALLSHFSAILIGLDAEGRVFWLSGPVQGLQLGQHMDEDALLASLGANGKSVRFSIQRLECQEIRGERWLLLESAHDQASGAKASPESREERKTQKAELLSLLAPSIAHEISNPIQGILNYSELIGELAEPDSSVVDFAGEITNEAERVSRTIRSLLELARQDPLKVRTESIGDVIGSVEPLLHSTLMRDHITLNAEFDSDAPTVTCVAQQLRLLLLNLVYLASESLNRGFPGRSRGKRIFMSIAARGEAEPGLFLSVRAAVDGDAPPAQPARRSRAEEELLDRFFRVSAEIALAHGGRLTRDVQDPGFAATLTLPQP